MSTNPFLTKLHEIEDRLNSKEISEQEAREEGHILCTYDITSLSIEEINDIENASCLSDDDSVFLMKKWLDLQNEKFMKIRSFLILTPQISAEQINNFMFSLNSPSIPITVDIKDIFYSFGTASGTQQYISPLPDIFNVKGRNIIDYEPKSTNEPKGIQCAFDENKNTYFSSSSHIIFIFPEFLKVCVKSYKIGSPIDCPGIQGWSLEGCEDETKYMQKNWKEIALESKNISLSEKNKICEFPAKKSTDVFFRYLRLTNNEQNFNRNNQLLFSKFDISGELLIDPK